MHVCIRYRDSQPKDQLRSSHTQAVNVVQSLMQPSIWKLNGAGLRLLTSVCVAIPSESFNFVFLRGPQ